jgi:anti-sigma B factor antagonist
MGTDGGFSIESSHEDGATVIVVHGDVDLATAPELRAACESAIAAAPDVVRLDLGELTFLDSSGISVLVKAHQELQRQGGSLVLHRLDDRTRRVLDVAGLSDFFERSDQPAR